MLNRNLRRNFTRLHFGSSLKTNIFQTGKLWLKLTLGAFLILACMAAAQAATFTVTKIADTNDGACDADCSLREAFAAANATNLPDTIEFNAAVFSMPQIITLTGGELTVNENGGNLTVNGAGANLLTVSGGGNSRVFFIASGASAAINNLKITGGNGAGTTFNNVGGAIAVYASRLDLNNAIISDNSVNGNGGGIYGFFNAQINLFNSTVSGNRAGGGGGIYANLNNTLNITGSSISGNTASGDGGGVYAIDGVSTINNSTVNDNTAKGGGGVFALEGTLTVGNSLINNNAGTSGGGISGLYSTISVFDSVISGNRATEEGGGIRRSGSGTLRLTRCRILNNTANGAGGGVMSVPGFVTGDDFLMTYSTVSGNRADVGGGIYNDGAATVVFSTIDHNTANGGGGIFNRIGLTLINSTVSGNRAVLEGGGINSNVGFLQLHHTTIAFNRAGTGAGIFMPSGTLQADTTIFADNFRDDSSPEDIYGTLNSGGYNLIESLQNTTVTGNSTGNIVGQDARLDPVLRNNGGLTQTHALRPNSPAIDAAFSVTAIVKTDQRGRSRTFDFPNIPNAPGSDATDIGAFERQADDAIPASTLFDFDGDGRSDISVFRPANGGWYLLQSQNGFGAAAFGVAADRIVPADYDGDGKTDLAVFRRSADSTWYILQSSDGGFRAVQWGASNLAQAIFFDTPVPADYDGDGKTDLAVWRTTDHLSEPGRFLILQSSDNSTRDQQWGSAFDRPVPADYDGDGKTDLAVYRGGTWYILRSSGNNLHVVSFGLSTDITVPADYDGDGKADFAVVRQSGGASIWYILGSSRGFYAVQFGTDTDKAVPADYDGDGKIDIAVFRPANGVWYLLQSTAGFAAVNFGTSTDLPIPNAYVR